MYNSTQEDLVMVEKLFLDGLIKNGSGNDTQLILLDDKSPIQGDTVKLVKKLESELRNKFGDFQFIVNEENLGFAGSYNKGLNRAEGNIIVTTNYDIRLTPDSLDSMIRHLEQGYDLVAPVTNNVGDAHQRITGFEPIRDYTEEEMERIDEFANRRRIDFQGRIKDVRFPMGMFWVLPREVRDEVGLFDERFEIAFWEDTDYGARVGKNNYRCAVDLSSFVYHGKAGDDPTSLGTMLKYPFKIKGHRLIFFKNQARFMRKHGLRTYLDYVRETAFSG